MASEMACSSACPSVLPTNACDRRKRAASAASTRCRNDWGSLSRSAASNSRCQCGYMLWDVGVFWSVTSETNAGRVPLGERAVAIPLIAFFLSLPGYREAWTSRNSRRSGGQISPEWWLYAVLVLTQDRTRMGTTTCSRTLGTLAGPSPFCC